MHLPDPLFDSPRLDDQGFYIEQRLLNTSSVARLLAIVEADVISAAGRGGVRNLLDLGTFRALTESAVLLQLVRQILGEGAFVVRGILFDKTDATNWKVPWHQDVTIAVTNRFEVDGYGPWSVKAGVTHVQPAASVLENMISVRIHLDDCPATNGPLRVLPRTHRNGKLSHAAIDAAVLANVSVTCEASEGDALIMRPLLIHASSPSSAPRHRRVAHFDCANVELAQNLDWYERRVLAETSLTPEATDLNRG